MSKFLNNFKASFAANGGHTGPATLQALNPQINRLKAEGLTGKQAGLVLAEHYKLNRAYGSLKERANA